MLKTEHENITYASSGEKSQREVLVDLIKATPIPDDELLDNLGVFVTSKLFARLLFYYEIYKKVVDTHGIIMEFGSRWGQTTSVLAALRGILEPFNRHRKIVGFDTFQGHVGVCEHDRGNVACSDGDYSVTEGYESYLAKIMDIQEGLNPLSHIKKYELIKGDAAVTVPDYLDKHPEALVSLAVFDFDIYKPTLAAMEAIKPRLFKGSVIVFDELCDEVFPGETQVLMDILGAGNCRVKRIPTCSRTSYMVVE